MTEQILTGLARQALNMARTDIRNRCFKTSILIASYHEKDGRLHRMERIERVIQQKLGERWLDSGHGKDIGFGILRMACDAMPPDAMIFVTSTNMFLPTEKMRALPREEQKRLMDKKHNSDYHQMAKEGLLEIVDSITAVAQTPELVVTCVAALDRDAPVETRTFDQEHFDGRLKMYGKHYVYHEPAQA